jgi:hypothetical protein
MSVLSVYRRKGGGYGEPLVGIGVLESETLTADLAANVARQLAGSAHALVSVECFEEGTLRDHR